MKRFFFGEENELVTEDAIRELWEYSKKTQKNKDSYEEFLQDVTTCGGYYAELEISEMTCRRFLYLLAHPEPLSLEQAIDGFEFSLHREIADKLIVTDDDTYAAIIISDPENASKLYRFVESDKAECQEVTE